MQKRRGSQLKATRPRRSLRVRVVRPMANGTPIASRDARRLLKAVMKHRPFAGSSREREEAAWTTIACTLADTTATSAINVEARFWYLLDVYKRHRMHGYALAGLGNGVVEMLESVALCVDTYGYAPRSSTPRCEDGDDTGDRDSNEDDIGDQSSEENDSRDHLSDVSEQRSREASTEDVIARTFSSLSEMKDLLMQSQHARTDQATQLDRVFDANEQLRNENEQLRGQVASLQSELHETLQRVGTLKAEHDTRDDEAATRTQRMRALMETLAAVLSDATGSERQPRAGDSR